MTRSGKSLGYGVQPRRFDGGGDPAGIAAYPLRDAARIDRPGGRRGRPQPVCLRIGAGFETAAAVIIATAGGQQFLETVGLAIDIRRRQQFEYRCGTQLLRTMHVAVIAGRQHRQIAAFAGDAQAFA